VRVVAALALCLAALAASCGYTSGMRLPEHYHSVGVEIFANDTLEPDLERDAHLAFTNQVIQLVRSPLAAPSRADVVLEGRLVEYSRRGGIRSGTDNSLYESAVVIRIEAWLVDRRSGERIGPPSLRGIRVGYVVDEDAAERQARDRALEYVAQQLVLDQFSRLD
jgi:hypothetical protein